MVWGRYKGLMLGLFVWTVQFSSVTQWCDFVTLWTAACQASVSITNSQTLLTLMSIESVMPPSHLIPCHSVLLPPSIFPSIRVFSNEPVLHNRWPQDWSFSFSIRPSGEYSGVISFGMDCLCGQWGLNVGPFGTEQDATVIAHCPPYPLPAFCLWKTLLKE